jgi:phage-related protein
LVCPIVRPLGHKLFEVRPKLTDGSEVRIFFIIYKKCMVLLHGFIKKTQKTPVRELNLARKRMKNFLDTIKE